MNRGYRITAVLCALELVSASLLIVVPPAKAFSLVASLHPANPESFTLEDREQAAWLALADYGTLAREDEECNDANDDGECDETSTKD